jgi:conjugal transfer pilus assembly protein TraD
MNASDRFNDYINAHPRESLILVVLGLSLLWQSVAAILALVVYVLFIRVMNGPRWLLLAAGLMVALVALYLQASQSTMIGFMQYGFRCNFTFWKLLFQHQSNAAFAFLFHYEFIYIMGFSLLIAGVLGVIDLIVNNPHEKMMKALQKGIHSDDLVEIKDTMVDKALKNMRDDNYNGTVLGVSKYNGQYVVVPDRDVNQVVLVLGTTGGGKTITLRRFYQRAIRKGYPLIVVDGKPDDTNIEWLKNLAEKNGRPFFGFNCGDKLHYDPLANGGFTELKDKIICLKDEWENDYYRSIAEDYLQTTLHVLLKSGVSLDLKQVVECLSYKNLVVLTKSTQDGELMKRVAGLSNYEMKDITGLQAHLNILIHSELGMFFEKDQNTFSLLDVIDQDGVVYFALPALRFPSFAKVLGKLVINDIKAVIDRQNNTERPVFTVFDEFSVFAGEQVLNLVNMGRGKGVHAIFGTQGLADLDKVDVSFKNQVLNCANTLICHRLNDQDSAETVSNWIGTEDSFTVTAQLNASQGDGGLGSVRRNKEFIVHPDAIKQGLQTGEAFYISKVRGFRWEKVRVRLL